jgi:hypothetical protein
MLKRIPRHSSCSPMGMSKWRTMRWRERERMWDAESFLLMVLFMLIALFGPHA